MKKDQVNTKENVNLKKEDEQNIKEKEEKLNEKNTEKSQIDKQESKEKDANNRDNEKVQGKDKNLKNNDEKEKDDKTKEEKTKEKTEKNKDDIKEKAEKQKEKDNQKLFEKEKNKEKKVNFDDEKDNPSTSKKIVEDEEKIKKDSKKEEKQIQEDNSNDKGVNKKSTSKSEEGLSDGSGSKEYSHKKNESYQNIKVLVRVRPFIKNEIEKGNVVFVNPRDDRIIKLGKNHSYFESSYEKTFGSFSTQKDIFRSVKNTIDQVINGVNCTILTYGQTGSGKTYTMFGADWTKYEKLDNINDNKNNDLKKSINNKRDDIFINDMIINPFSEENGIIPRSINYLFSELEIFNLKSKKYNVYISFLQVHNDNIYDLLDEEQNLDKQTNLRIREDKINGIYVEDLSEFLIENVYDCLNLLKRGERTRRRRQSIKNDINIKSHTVLQIIVEYDRVTEKGILKRSKLNFCNLAGSEKIDNENEKNSLISLSALGKVIHALSTSDKHVPYRDSKITRLLQDSLGGNTLTYLICTLSPSWDSFEESLNTLRFADRAKNVKTSIKISDTNIYDENLVKNLKEEIHNLKDILKIRKKRGNITNQEEEILKLKRENQKLKQYVLSNIEVQKIVEENKKLKQKLIKYENEEFQNSSKIKDNDSDYSYQKDYNNYDSQNREKDKYDKNYLIDDEYTQQNKKEEYYKRDNIYEGGFYGEKNDEIYGYENNNPHQGEYRSSYDGPNYYDKSPYSNQNNKKLFQKQLSPRGMRNEYYMNNQNSKSLNYSGKYHPNSYHLTGNYNPGNYKYNYHSPPKIKYPPLNRENSNYYDLRSKSNLLKGGEMIIRKGNEENERDIKANDRLRILERLEHETGLNLQREIEKIEMEKRKMKEEKWMKSQERKKNYEKMDNSMNKIKYLYRNNEDNYNHLYRPKFDSIENSSESLDRNAKLKNYDLGLDEEDDLDKLIKINASKYKDDKYKKKYERSNYVNDDSNYDQEYDKGINSKIKNDENTKKKEELKNSNDNQLKKERDKNKELKDNNKEKSNEYKENKKDFQKENSKGENFESGKKDLSNQIKNDNTDLSNKENSSNFEKKNSKSIEDNLKNTNIENKKNSLNYDKNFDNSKKDLKNEGDGLNNDKNKDSKSEAKNKPLF